MGVAGTCVVSFSRKIYNVRLGVKLDARLGAVPMPAKSCVACYASAWPQTPRATPGIVCATLRRCFYGSAEDLLKKNAPILRFTLRRFGSVLGAQEQRAFSGGCRGNTPTRGCFGCGCAMQQDARNIPASRPKERENKNPRRGSSLGLRAGVKNNPEKIFITLKNFSGF